MLLSQELLLSENQQIADKSQQNTLETVGQSKEFWYNTKSSPTTTINYKYILYNIPLKNTSKAHKQQIESIIYQKGQKYTAQEIMSTK